MTVIEGVETTYIDIWSVGWSIGIGEHGIFLKGSTFANDIHLDRRTIDFLEILRSGPLYNHYGKEIKVEALLNN